MDIFDSSKSVVSPEDLLDGVDFVSDFTAELAQYTNRLTGSANETAAARAIRNRLHDETNAKTRLEAFRAYPLLGRGVFPFLGLWYLLSFLLYYVSFAGGRLAGVLLALLALVVFVSGGAMWVSLFLGRKTFRGILNSKVSYNVVSERKKTTDDGNERVFVICDNHDAVVGSYAKDFGALRKLTMIIAPVSALLFILFCILKMAIGADTTPKITVFSVLPAIFGVFGIFAIMTHFSPLEQHARQNNGVATSVAMATYAYFVEKSELLPNDVRLVYASFGGENSGHGGSDAFVRMHPEFARAKVLCLGDILSGDLKVAEFDAVRKIAFSTDVVSTVRSSAHEQDIKISTVEHDSLKHKFNSLHGYTSNSFAKNGIASATVLAKDYNSRARDLDRNDMEKLFSLCVGTLQKMMAVQDAPKEDVAVFAPSTDMEIKGVKVK